MDVSDLIRALSDLCIQAYQQLLSITEKRLQNIIGAVTGDVSALPAAFCLTACFAPPPFPQFLPCWRARTSRVCRHLQSSW